MKINSASFPVHLILLPVFFIVHTVNAYFGLLPWSAILQAILVYLLITAIVWLTGKLLFRSGEKAGLWATGLLIPFFFFGAFHDFIKNLSLPSVLTSYTLLLPVILALYILLTVYIKRTSRSFPKTGRFLSVLFIIISGIEMMLLLYNFVTSQDKKQHIAGDTSPVVEQLAPVAGNNAPDIFFIVFDEYASSASLGKYFNYSNSQLDSSLLSNNFFIAGQSKSNYNCTPISIASTLDMHYFDTPLENQFTSPIVMLRGWYTLSMSRLPDLLHKAGYKIYNFGLCHFNNYPAQTDRYFADYEYLLLHGVTLWGRIEKDILWNIHTLNIPLLQKAGLKKLNNERNKLISNNRSNQQHLLHELNRQNNQPKFVFGHIMMPHLPYYLDRHGNSTNIFSPVYSSQNNKQLYLDQLIYTNSWIDSLAKAANQPFTRPRVVIIEGDHGFREEDAQSPRDMQFMNLNCQYFSDKDKSMLYDSISPVNTFRIILNKYFNTRLSLLKDSTIRLR